MDGITDRIWIGNYLDAKDLSALGEAGIRSIVCLDGCLAGVTAEEAGVERVEVVELLVDGAGNSPETFLQAVRRSQEETPARRCSEREPADSPGDEYNVIGGWLPSLTCSFGSDRIDLNP